MSRIKICAAVLAAVCAAAVLSGCTSERSGDSTAEIAEVTSEADSAAETEAETEPVTEAVTEAETTEAETTETEAEPEDAEATEPAEDSVPAVSNIILTHITEGGEGLGVFHNLSGSIRGEIMKDHAEYKNWKLDKASGYAEENDTVKEAEASFTYGEKGGFSVNGTVEVMPADDPDYPNKMYFHSDDVDAFPRFMIDNRGEARKAKFIIENSGDVYRMLEKNDPPEEKSFSVSVTVDTVTVRYSADGSVYDTIHVTAASNR